MRILARIWNMGVKHDTPVPDRQGCVELVLPDGRTVQMLLDLDGHLLVRAWAAEPLVTGNGHVLLMHADVPTLEQMLTDDQPVEPPRATTRRLTARDIISPDGDPETWAIADPHDQKRATDLLTRIASHQ